MSELLFEIFCEEIPARMQKRAEADLERLLCAKLQEAGLDWSRCVTFVGPRRLGLTLNGLQKETKAVHEERKGPRTSAPDQALQGFLRGAGLDSLDQCETREDKKGEYYVAVIETPGRSATDVIAESIPQVLKAFPWPKSMKFGEDERAQRWVRPLQRLLCLFDGEVVPFEVFGISTGDETEGHRVHGRGPFKIKDFADYTQTLSQDGFVMQQNAERESTILAGAKSVCEAAGLELVEDAGLLAEVAGLVEHPIPLLGEMEPAFLDLPPEVITLTMKTHQKYFAVRDPKTNTLSANFVVVANQEAPDGGKAIAAGNARVLSARLADARHFWDNDLKTSLSERARELSKVTFHEKLGTVADKVERVAVLARELAPVVGADPDLAEKAARLAKADLVSEMVYEFPELQGAMGRYYALEQGEDAAVADAIKDHYKPQGPSDAVPTAPVSAAVALADKLDTLASFWVIDEKPTGSKDPFALRRAALGVIRILLDGGFRLPLISRDGHYAAQMAFGRSLFKAILIAAENDDEALYEALNARCGGAGPVWDAAKIGAPGYEDLALVPYQCFLPGQAPFDLLAFFADRLKVHLRDEGVRHDVIDAVFALGDDDLVRVTARSRALQAFLDTEDGTALLAGFKRASNILNKTDDLPEGEHAADRCVEPAEKELAAALATARPAAQKAQADEDFTAAMAALAGLRAPIDTFFDTVTVNAEDSDLRKNRLLLLSDIRAAICAVADFNRIEG